MPLRNECVRAAVKELEHVGIKPVIETTNGNHVKVGWITKDGKSGLVICANTPSDRRAPDNTRATVRRQLRDQGALDGLRERRVCAVKTLSLQPKEIGQTARQEALAKALSLPGQDLRMLQRLERLEKLESTVKEVLDQIRPERLPTYISRRDLRRLIRIRELIS
jgi:hypothetical protein